MAVMRPAGGATKQDDAVDRAIQADVATAPAWEQVEAGRFMPRRICGSDRGRALG